jgi:3-isopropylmalate/(R)-2-methylmalate dehydratase small subunit
MKAVTIISGRGVPLKRSDVDTDQIIPAEWLKRVERTGFEKGLFSTWRDDRSFVLNDERYAGASVLVAGPSFGVGSSREHAVWANGLVPVVLSEPTVNRIWEVLEADPSAEITIDIQRLTVEIPSAGITESFEMDASMQDRFIKGLDDIAITLSNADSISTFEATRPAWLAAK